MFRTPGLSSHSVTAEPAPARPPIHIRRGACFPLFVFDIALSIDLDEANRLLAAGSRRTSLKAARKSPPYFDFKPAPLLVTLPAEPIKIAGRATEPLVELRAFDFGAVCVTYRLPLDGELFGLLDLGAELFDHAALRADAQRRVAAFARDINAAARKPGPTDQIEDYLIYQIQEVTIGESGEPVPPSRLIEAAPGLLARILRSESIPMSDEQVTDALSCRGSYRPDDCVIVDWNAALLLDAEADEIRPVLEFANVELLEMRFLDDRLDEILEEAYLASQRSRVGWRAIFPSSSARVRRIAQLQIDSALLFEGVNNALKLIGDQYLARVYRLAAQRFHLPERDATIERKLQTLQSIYTKMSDHESGRRAETLEWIIIILIAFEVVMGIFRALTP